MSPSECVQWWVCFVCCIVIEMTSLSCPSHCQTLGPPTSRDQPFKTRHWCSTNLTKIIDNLWAADVHKTSASTAARVIKTCFLSLARGKLRLCSANHRAGCWSNLPCDWLSIVTAYSEQEAENEQDTENGPSIMTWDVGLSGHNECFIIPQGIEGSQPNTWSDIKHSALQPVPFNIDNVCM